MKFPHLAVLALFFVGVVGSDARPLSSAEDYWHSIWPDTPMPKNLQQLLKPADNGEIEDTQYPYTFFFEDDLYLGNQINIKFNKDHFAQPYTVFAWKKVTNDAPSDAVIRMTKNTNVESVESKTKRLPIEEICEKGPLFEGENSKICAKSVKSLVDFVISKLGKDVEPLSSSFVPHQTQYTILEGAQRVGEKGVMCHKLNSQKPVFYCHQVNASIAYTIPLEAADGTKTKAVVICHHDTRGLNPHILFHQLKVMPGTMPICHFIGSKALVWVPKINKATA